MIVNQPTESKKNLSNLSLLNLIESNIAMINLVSMNLHSYNINLYFIETSNTLKFLTPCKISTWNNILGIIFFFISTIRKNNLPSENKFTKLNNIYFSIINLFKWKLMIYLDAKC